MATPEPLDYSGKTPETNFRKKLLVMRVLAIVVLATCGTLEILNFAAGNTLPRVDGAGRKDGARCGLGRVYNTGVRGSPRKWASDFYD